jgi:hypothetical protein
MRLARLYEIFPLLCPLWGTPMRIVALPGFLGLMGIAPPIGPLFDGRFRELISTAAKGRPRALTPWRDGPILQHKRLDFLISNIAHSVSADPPILLLAEPTAALVACNRPRHPCCDTRPFLWCQVMATMPPHPPIQTDVDGRRRCAESRSDPTGVEDHRSRGRGGRRSRLWRNAHRGPDAASSPAHKNSSIR